MWICESSVEFHTIPRNAQVSAVWCCSGIALIFDLQKFHANFQTDKQIAFVETVPFSKYGFGGI